MVVKQPEVVGLPEVTQKDPSALYKMNAKSDAPLDRYSLPCPDPKPVVQKLKAEPQADLLQVPQQKQPSERRSYDMGSEKSFRDRSVSPIQSFSANSSHNGDENEPEY